jgi:1-phosphofructokinase family hexose kinase
MLALAGGKGFNFARAIRTLGLQPLVVGPLGGYTGRTLLDLAVAEGFRCEAVMIEGETRTCLTVVDTENARITEIYEAGPALSATDWAQLLEAAAPYVAQATAAVVGGSCPPGAPPGAVREIVELAHAASIPAMLDTYGSQLDHALEARPDLVKINADEAAGTLGHPIEGVPAAVEAATELQDRGAQAVVITLGKQGAAGVDGSGTRFGWAAPQVPGVYPTGSGDSFFGGLVAGLTLGQTLAEAVRLGIAVGSANTLQPGAGVFDPSQIERLLDEVQPLV